MDRALETIFEAPLPENNFLKAIIPYFSQGCSPDYIAHKSEVEKLCLIKDLTTREDIELVVIASTLVPMLHRADVKAFDSLSNQIMPHRGALSQMHMDLVRLDWRSFLYEIIPMLKSTINRIESNKHKTSQSSNGQSTNQSQEANEYREKSLAVLKQNYGLNDLTLNDQSTYEGSTFDYISTFGQQTVLSNYIYDHKLPNLDQLKEEISTIIKNTTTNPRLDYFLIYYSEDVQSPPPVFKDNTMPTPEEMENFFNAQPKPIRKLDTFYDLLSKSTGKPQNLNRCIEVHVSNGKVDFSTTSRKSNMIISL